MSHTIQPFNGEYDELAELRNSVYPDYALRPVDLQRVDDQRDPRCHMARFIVRDGGQLVAAGHYGHLSELFHPNKLEIRVFVRQERRGQGLGARLYEHLIAESRQLEPITLLTMIREDAPESLAFAGRRGFTERMRNWESILDVASFDPGRFAGASERALGGGIRITTLRALSAGDPDHQRKLYDLIMALMGDVPLPGEFTPMAFEPWAQAVFTHPGLMPDGYFVALDGERYVGVSQLWRRSSGDMLETGLTGVLRDYRRRGIALALKLQAIEHARQIGMARIRTDNESNNRAMLSINEALGFARQPAWISLAKDL